MNFDISHLLDGWEYQAGQVMVRRFLGKDGKEKIQLRVDLGILQMNAHGRPDGKKPHGHPTLLEYYQAKAKGAEDFSLNADDCTQLQLEALQYHHRYICLLQLEDFQAVINDTERNLSVLEFVDEHAQNDEVAWSLHQFFPQILLMHLRGSAALSLQESNYPQAITRIREGMDELREFYHQHGRSELIEQSAELQSLEHWITEIESKRPRTKREQLQLALDEAVKREDYEKAAQVRDQLRKMKSTD